jgi:hypothetical protein
MPIFQLNKICKTPEKKQFEKAGKEFYKKRTSITRDVKTASAAPEWLEWFYVFPRRCGECQ